MPRRREEDLKKNTNITDFTHKLPPIWLGGHEIYSFSSPDPIDLLKFHPVVLENKMFTHDRGQTQTHSNRSLSDPGDLKME